MTRYWLPAGALALLAAIYVLASRHSSTLGLFWVFGIGFGFVLQRGRFCFASAFRDLFLLRQGHVMKGVLVGLGVATLGFAMTMASMVPNPSLGALPGEAHIFPLGPYIVLAGALFGLGMVLAGGCVSGSLYRMGEGYVGSMVALAGVLLGLYTLNRTWNWLWDAAIDGMPKVWLPRYMGYSGAIAGTLALLALTYLFILWLESRRWGPALSTQPARAYGPPLVPPITAALGGQGFRQQLAQAWRTVFVQGWSPLVAGAILGGLNALLYTGYHPWRIIGELSRWGNEAFGVAGLGVGPLKGAEELGGCSLQAGQGDFFIPMLTLTWGLVAGSFTAAALAGEFKLRWPRKPVRYGQSLAGGLLMGYGGGLAAGCTIGAFFSAVPSLALNGYIFALSLALGAFIAIPILRRLG